MMVDPDNLKEPQRAKFAPWFGYLADLTAPLPPKDMFGNMTCYTARIYPVT